MISSEECFSAWAPDGAAWTEWAKPVVFSTPSGMLPSDAPAPQPAAAPPDVGDASGGAAVIVDVPGDEAVELGLVLAAKGFRPVPLFNGTQGPSPVIDLEQVVKGLGAGAARLRQLPLAADAPPAFLLDARRGLDAGRVEPGRYDNRWIVLPQDFPSAAFLASRGIRQVTLILRGATSPSVDLSHVLLRWQQAGLRIRVVDLATGRVDDNVRVREPNWFRRACYAALAIMRLRRSNIGGFGSAVPQQSASHGAFG